MAKFINTTGINYYLEEMIRNTRTHLILISPFLKLNERIKALLEDKNRLKIDIRIVYGKSELQAEELNWLKTQTYIRTSFCRNLHAKCYMNEEACMITSLNLHEFSQINNNEMGVFVNRYEDPLLYQDAYEEAQHLIRISDEVPFIPEAAVKETEMPPLPQNPATPEAPDKLASSKIAQKLGLKTDELIEKLLKTGYLACKGETRYLTSKGKAAGGEFRMSQRFGPYFLWPEDFEP